MDALARLAEEVAEGFGSLKADLTALARVAALAMALEDVALGALDFRNARAREALDFFALVFRRRWRPRPRILRSAPESLKLDAVRSGIIDALALGRRRSQRVRIGPRWLKGDQGTILAGTVPVLADTWTDEIFWAWLESRALRHARAWLADAVGMPAADVPGGDPGDVPDPDDRLDRLESLLDARGELHRVHELATAEQRRILAELLAQADAGERPNFARAAERLGLAPGTVRDHRAAAPGWPGGPREGPFYGPTAY